MTAPSRASGVVPRAVTLLLLAIAQPHLMATHLGGYADLVRSELAASGAGLGRRACLLAITAVCSLCALILMGVALMNWATAAPGSLSNPWVLLLVPALPLLAALLAWAAWRREPPLSLWTALQAQWSADAATLAAHER